MLQTTNQPLLCSTLRETPEFPQPQLGSPYGKPSHAGALSSDPHPTYFCIFHDVVFGASCATSFTWSHITLLIGFRLWKLQMCQGTATIERTVPDRFD